ncbi:hypothetical protein J6590_000507 [Homalodisca vitripennis]|nr:hypothetical protein J6590_000507 [Homalodisca vitripennis]
MGRLISWQLLVNCWLVTDGHSPDCSPRSLTDYHTNEWLLLHQFARDRLLRTTINRSKYIVSPVLRADCIGTGDNLLPICGANCGRVLTRVLRPWRKSTEKGPSFSSSTNCEQLIKSGNNGHEQLASRRIDVT